MVPDYSASKAAMINLTVSLSKELAGTGVTANTVTPGLIHTEGVETFYRGIASRSGWGDDWSGIEAKIVSTVLPNSARRLGRPDEVGDVVAFLASARASYITGANIRVDGGSTPTVN
jgi:NAD(P)-dependent dehydrogenase (short-subunit alcohol dehydrogenase family)